MRNDHAVISARAGGAVRESAAQMRVLGHTTRLRVIQELSATALTCNELAEGLKLPPQNVVRHLQALSAVGLLSRRRERTGLRYSVTDADVLDIVRLVVARVSLQLHDLTMP